MNGVFKNYKKVWKNSYVLTQTDKSILAKKSYVTGFFYTILSHLFDNIY